MYKMRRKMVNKKLIKFLGLIVFMVGAFFLSRYFLSLDVEMVRAYVDSFGMLAPVVYVVIYSIGTILFFPGSVLTISGGAIFGVVKGALYNIIGVGIGASLAFLIARYFGRGFIEDFIYSKFGRLEHYDEKLQGNGFTTVLFLRLIPIFPFNALNFVLGLSKVKFKDYFLATVIGTIPGTFVYTYFGASLIMLDLVNIVISIVLIILLALVFPVYKRYERRWKDDDYKF